MRWTYGVAVLVCGSLALAACSGDDDATAAGAAGEGPLAGQLSDGGGNGTTSVPPAPGGGTGDPSALPDDACAVMPADQVEALVPGARVEGPENAGAEGHSQAHCSWANDTRTLNLNYIGGVPNAQLQLSMETDTRDGNGELTTIAGDEAGIVTLITGDLEINVVHDDIYITVGLLTIDGPANDHRDALVSLAEAAVSTL